jgi:TP901 family phage tail tape measure protein
MVEKIGAVVAIDVQMNTTNAVSQVKQVGNVLDETGVKMSQSRTTFLYMAFGLMAAGGVLNRVGNTVGKVVSQMTSAFSEVEYQSSIVGTVLGATAEQTKRVTEEMLALSIQTGFTAKEVGQAMQSLAMAGFNLTETMAATRGVLDLARVGMISVSEATELAVGVFNGYSMKARDAASITQTMAGITGELAYAANSSVVTVQSLGEAFKYVAAAADLANWSFEETTTVLMTAGDNMIRAGIAGRALRISLVNLQKIAAASQGTIAGGAATVKMYGLEILKTDGTLKGMADIVEELQIKLAGLSSVQRNAALQSIFGTEALTLWSALYSSNVKDLRDTELGLAAVGAKEALMVKFGGNVTKSKLVIEYSTNDHLDELLSGLRKAR